MFVMLPLDTINSDGVFRYAASRWFLPALQQLKESGIHGVAVDVWWGAVERRPRRYDWSGYRQLFDIIAALGLKLQVVIAFHACGGNVGDNAEVPLPGWVVAAGERDPDIFFTDRPRESSPGQRNRECISLFAAEEPGLLKGRSAMQCYVDFMRAFRDEFIGEVGELIEEVVIGAGPCGELRFPSYPEPNGWRFPGCGEFQCYDRRALASLARAASAVGQPEWGNAGPHDAGTYNCGPDETGFFQGWGGRWDSEYGRFFLKWYSQALVDHGDKMMNATASVFNIASSRTDDNDDGNGGGSGGNTTTNTTTTTTSGDGGGGDDSKVNDGGSGDVSMQLDDPPLPPRNTTTTMAMSVENDSSSDAAPSRQGSGSGGQLPSPTTITTDANDGGGGNTTTTATTTTTTTTTTTMYYMNGEGEFAPTNTTVVNNNNTPASATTNSLGGGGSGGTMGGGVVSRPASYNSFRSSSISEGLNTLEDWTWPSPAGTPVCITLKIAGVHWWYRTRSHAAEVTAGYYNCEGQRGYDAIIHLCARYGANLTLTCVEMCDSQHPPEALCGREGLLRQVREVAAAAGVEVGGENALPCFMPNVIDEIALQRVVYNTQPWGTPLEQGADAGGGGGGDGNTIGGDVNSAAAGTTTAAAVGTDVYEEFLSNAEGFNTMQFSPGGGGGGGGGRSNQFPVGHFAMSGSGTVLSSSSGIAGTGGGAAGTYGVVGSEEPRLDAKLPPMRSFTFLRLTPEMMNPSYFEKWNRFMVLMAHNAERFKTSPRWRQNMGLSSQS